MHDGMSARMFEIVWHASCNVTRHLASTTTFIGGFGMDKLKRFIKDEKGVTSLEYGLIAAVTCVAILGGLAVVKPNLAAIWDSIGTALIP